MPPTATNDDTVTRPSRVASASEGNERSNTGGSRSESGASTTAAVPRRQKKSDPSPPAKRQKKSSMEEEMICSISLELLVDPVMAEDDHLYERESIRKYFKGQARGPRVKSPLTRELMGKKLRPAPYITNIIRRLIENEVITGDSAQKWKTKIKQKEETDQLKKKTTEGDVEAMMELGEKYYFGRNGEEKDYAEAFKWFEKAHSAGLMEATAIVGTMLVRGRGVEVDTTTGLVYLGKASNASDYAAFRLGTAFAYGRYGLKVKKKEALCFLELVVSGNCTHQHLNERQKKEAIELLKDLKDPNFNQSDEI